MAEKNFESALQALENIVTDLESEDLSLEKSLALFEQGIALSRQCGKELAAAEEKVSHLLEELEKSRQAQGAEDPAGGKA